jgi:hypothetical protein
LADPGKEGTLAYLQSRVPKVRFDPETEGLVQDKPLEEKAPETEDKPKGISEEAPKPEEEVKPASKFKTKAEAERAHAEAEKKMHTATTETAKEKAAREAVERENAELKQKLEALSKAAEKPPEESQKPVVGEERQKRIRAATKAAFSKIRDLDRRADEYDDQVEEAWAEALLEVGLSASGLTEAEAEKAVKRLLDAERKVADDAAAEQRKKDQDEADAQVRQTATEMATQAGLDMTPRSQDFINFWYVANNELAEQEFMKAEKAPPLKTQVDWVIRRAREIAGTKVEQTQEELEKARKVQEKNKVLTLGTNLTPSKEETLTEPVSLAVLQRQMREQQRTRHRGA